MNKKFKKKQLLFKSSIGVDGFPETLNNKNHIQLINEENAGNMVVEFCKL